MALRIGMIGSEGHTGMVLNGIPKVLGATLCACAKGHPNDSLSPIRNHHTFTKKTIVYSDFKIMLENEALDIVGICRPYSLNAEAVIAAAQKNIHIICEKPIATNLDDLQILENTVNQTGVRLSAMLGMRLLPVFQAARKAVIQGLIGEPILATAQKSYKWGTRPNFFKTRETYGGTIPWVAIHAVDYTRWICGLEYTKVTALQGNLAHPDFPGSEDHGGILFMLSNGGTAMINFDYLRPESAPSHGDDRLRIAGSEGVLEIVGPGNRTELIQTNKPPFDLPLPNETDFLVDFVRELRGESQHVIGPKEAVLATRICLKAREAADNGQIMRL